MGIPYGRWFALLCMLLLPCGVAQAQCLHSLTFVDMGTPHGDVDDNGLLNVTDVQCTVLTALWDLGGSSGDYPDCVVGPVSRADVLCDGGVDVTDILVVISLVLDVPLDVSIDSDADGCPEKCGPPSVRRGLATSTVDVASGGGYVLRQAPVASQAIGSSTDGEFTLRALPIRTIPDPEDEP